MSYIWKKPLDGAEVSQLPEVEIAEKKASETIVRVVKTYEERQMTAVIRAAVWIGEEDGNYIDHFDDNDHCASHLIAFVDGEPAGTIRCRWFGEFARLERLTIRKRFRSLKVLRALVTSAIRLCEEKGYEVIIGQARTDVVPFWRRMGGAVCGAARDTVYGALHPMMMRRPRRPDAPSLDKVGDLAFERRIAGWEAAGVA